MAAPKSVPKARVKPEPAIRRAEPVPEGQEGVLCECHACGHGCGSTLGQFKVAEHQAALVDRRRLACPKCGHPDVSRTQLTEQAMSRMESNALRARIKERDAEVDRLKRENEEIRKRFGRMGPLPEPAKDKTKEPVAAGPARGQHEA